MRTFIAIELEEETKAQLAEVQAEAEKLCRRGNYTPKENFHLTLHFLGEVQERIWIICMRQFTKRHAAIVPLR